MRRGRLLLRTAAVVATLLALAALVARDLPSALAAVGDPQRVVDVEGADALVLYATQLVLLILCAWCALGAVVMALAAFRTPGPLGRMAQRLLPAGSRRLLGAALGIGVLSLTACAQPDTLAAPPSTTPIYAASADAFDWGVAQETPAGATTPGATSTPSPLDSSPSSESSPSSDSNPGQLTDAAPAPDSPLEAPPGEAPTPHGVGGYVVAAGDSLWSIASAHLSPGHTPAEVAYLVDELYQANQDVIGANPDLLSVGAELRIPASAAPAG